MINNFSCKDTELIWHGYVSKKFPREIQKKSLIKLRILEASTKLENLQVPPGNKLEKLKGTRKNQYSIRVNEQWRICFDWSNGYAYDVKIIDYHK